MSHHHMEYATLMREKGFRITPQREIILDAVCIGNGHSTIEQISERVGTVAPAISTATIYRTLDFFVRLGVILTGHVLGERIFEASVGVPHHHLACTQCRRCFDLPDIALGDLRHELERGQGFLAEIDHLIIEGICAECQQKQ